MTSSIHNVKLTYFNARGRAEITRYILNYLSIPYQDDRIPMSEWPKLKHSMPLGQVPVFSFDDDEGTHQVFTQSAAIVRSLARWYGLNGNSAKETCIADQVYECLRDISDGAAKQVAWESNLEKKEQNAAQMMKDTIPRNLAFLEKTLKANGGKFIAGGDSFTYADFAVAVVLDNISKDIVIVPNQAFRSLLLDSKEAEEKYPGLSALKKSVEEHPKIASYLASRPVTSF